MLTLNDGRAELWQWDTGRTLAVDADCSQVHFSNKVFGRSIDVDVVDGAAVIPDILLQTDKELNVWAFVGTAENGYTKISKIFTVNRRNKPADYVFTPTDQTTLAELVGRLGKLEESQGPDAIKNAVEDYLKQNPVEAPVQSVNGQTGTVKLTATDVGAISQGDLQTATNEVLAQAKASGEFDGADGAPGKDGADGQPGKNGTDGYSPTANVTQNDNGATITITDKNGTTTATVTNGKDGADGSPGPAGADGKTAYAYAVEGGYTGTETEFAAKLAEEMPEALPNPNALTFTGAVTGSYDGSAALSVEIPSGGSGGSSEEKTWRLIKTIEITEEVASISFGLDEDGNPFEVESLLIYAGLNVKSSGNSQFQVHLNGSSSAITSPNSFVGTSAKSIYWKTDWAGLRVAVMGSMTYDFKGVAGGASNVRLADSPQKITSVAIKLQDTYTFTAGKLYFYGR